MLMATFALCLPLLASDNFDSIKAKAEQGDTPAQCILGFCYSDGTGVEKDGVEAVKLYRKAADQGLVDAQSNLGRCYENGIGVEKDDVEAYAFYNLAGISYEKARGLRDELEKKMSPSQVAEGQCRTKELKARFVKPNAQ